MSQNPLKTKRKSKKLAESTYNDLPTINVPGKNEDAPNYIEDTQTESELTKIANTKICKEF